MIITASAYQRHASLGTQPTARPMSANACLARYLVACQVAETAMTLNRCPAIAMAGQAIAAQARNRGTFA